MADLNKQRVYVNFCLKLWKNYRKRLEFSKQRYCLQWQLRNQTESRCCYSDTPRPLYLTLLCAVQYKTQGHFNVLGIAVSFVQYEPHGHAERSWEIASFCTVQKRTDNYTSFVPSTDTAKHSPDSRLVLGCDVFHSIKKQSDNCRWPLLR